MYIVAIGWAYVVLLLALTANSLAKALAVLIFLGIVPALLFAFLAGKLMPRRRSVAMPDEPGRQRNAADSEAD